MRGDRRSLARSWTAPSRGVAGRPVAGVDFLGRPSTESTKLAAAVSGGARGHHVESFRRAALAGGWLRWPLIGAVRGWAVVLGVAPFREPRSPRVVLAGAAVQRFMDGGDVLTLAAQTADVGGREESCAAVGRRRLRQSMANVRRTRPVLGFGPKEVDLRGTRSPPAATASTSSTASGLRSTAVPPVRMASRTAASVS